MKLPEKITKRLISAEGIYENLKIYCIDRGREGHVGWNMMIDKRDSKIGSNDETVDCK